MHIAMRCNIHCSVEHMYDDGVRGMNYHPIILYVPFGPQIPERTLPDPHQKVTYRYGLILTIKLVFSRPRSTTVLLTLPILAMPMPSD